MNLKIHCAHDAMVALSELRPHPKNRNTHPKTQIKRLAEILAYQGFRYPIKVSTRSGFITSGHGRLEAAKLLGLEKVPVNYQEYESEEQEYADLVADNAIALWAEFDLKGVKDDIKNLKEDFKIDLMGIKDFEIKDEGNEGDGDPDAVPETPPEPTSKPGDLFQLGDHRLLCGDSTLAADVALLMNGEKADLVFTDPPYGVNYDGGHANEKRRELLANDHSTSIYKNSVPNMFEFSKPSAALYLWFAAAKSTQVLDVLNALDESKYEIRSWLIWNKNVAQFGAIGAQYKQKHEPCLYCFKSGTPPFWQGPTNEVSVWDEDRARSNEYHPTQKPVQLSERAMRNSCPHNGVVLDLFLGSGSTLIACEKTARRCYGLEIDPGYCDVIIARWEKFAGKKAVKLMGK